MVNDFSSRKGNKKNIGATRCYTYISINFLYFSYFFDIYLLFWSGIHILV